MSASHIDEVSPSAGDADVGTSIPDALLQALLIEKLVCDSRRRRLLASGHLELTGVRLAGEQFLILMLNDFGGIPVFTPTSLGGSGNLLENSIRVKITDTINTVLLCYPFVNGNDRYFLVNLRAPVSPGDDSCEKEVVSRLISLCRMCVNDIYGEYGARIQLLISPLIPDLSMMDSGFATLKKLYRVSLLEQLSEDVISAGELNRRNLERGRPRARRHSLGALILISAAELRFDDACSAFTRFIDNAAAGGQPPERVGALVCRQIERLFDVLDTPADSCDPRLMLGRYLDRISRAGSADELKTLINELMSELNSCFFPPVRPIAARIDEVADYIRRNYADDTLSLSRLCEEFGVSSSYLSRMFSRVYGVKLIDFIHQTRVDRAKRLLADQGWTVEATALAVGYHNALTFTRAFKQLEGTTPGAFRCASLEYAE